MTDALKLEGRARDSAVVLPEGLDPREGGRNKQGRPQEAQVRTLERPQEREVVQHPKVDSDLDALPQKVQDTFHERVEMLRRGDRHPSTHPLTTPLKGWHATSVGGNQHRMIHRFSEGALQILSVGNHDEAYKQGARRAVAMGQAGPDYDNLTFHHGEHPLYPAENDFKTLFAHHPEHGEVGRLTYRVHDHPDWTGFESPTVHVTMMHVEPEHQRRGVASQLMNHLENHVHPDTLIDHGDRRPEGHDWAKSHYNDPKGGKEKSFSGEFSGGKSQYTKNGRPWNLETKKPYRMPKKEAADSPSKTWYHGTSYEHAQDIINNGARKGLNVITQQSHANNYARLQAQFHSESGRGVVLEGHLDGDEEEHPWDRDREGKAYKGIAVTSRPNAFIPTHIHEVPAWERGEEPSTTRHKIAAAFVPKLRVFTHTCGLDHRLWDTDEKLKPEVRAYILHSMTIMWGQKYNNWSNWSRIYFAGSEASEWTSETLEGNNDFDVLVGVDYDAFRKANPIYAYASNETITDEMNQGFRAYNGPVMLTVDGVQYGPFDRTSYVNADAYDIRDIKPYAAYDVGKNEWVVKPPHLPHWGLDKLPDATQKVLRATDSLARRTLKLPEPERTQQGAALFDAWHSDRSRAFGPNGEGWWDIANLREKWLDQAGLWAQIVDCKHRFNEGLGAAVDWSNTPKTAAASGFAEHNHFAERLDKSEEEEPYIVPRKDEYAKDITTHTGHDYRMLTHNSMVTVHKKMPSGKYQGVGYLSWFPGKPTHSNSNIDGGVIHKVYVSSPHRRRGLASHMLDYAREQHPDMDIRHSNALSEDGQAWAEKKAAFKPPTHEMMRPSELEGYHGRDDLDQPHMRPKIEELRNSIIQNGYVHGWGDDIRVGHTPEHGPTIQNGNKRLHILRQLGYDAPIPVRTSTVKTASPDKYFEDEPNFWRMWNKPAVGSKKTANTNPAFEVMDAVRDHLTDDLLKPEYRSREDRKPTSGHCYAASEAVYHLMGGKESGLTPMNIKHEGDSHWYLRDKGGNYIDPTHDQFKTPVPYHEGKGAGFLTKEPSKRARELINRVNQKTGAWNDFGDLPEGRKPKPKHVKRAGFAGFVAGSDYLKHFRGKNIPANEQPDAIDDHLAHFARMHGTQMSVWKNHGTLGMVDLSHGVHATQTHVAQFHVDRYREKPHDTAWHFHENNPEMVDDEEADQDSKDYSDSPMFVTHQGRLHAIDGHHRVAATLQDGHKQAFGWHYNLDEHPVVHVNGNDCPTCIRHGAESHAEARTASKAHSLWGKGLHALFRPDEDGPPSMASAPFPPARQRKDRHSYDQALVARSITHPHEFPTEKVDPRELHGTQPSVTYAGVKHYMEGGEDYGKQNGGDHRLGNDVPRIYHRLDDDHKFILSGHHRAAAALLKGEPMNAKIVSGGFGADRNK